MARTPVTLHVNQYHTVVARPSADALTGFASIQSLSLYYHGMPIWIAYEKASAVMPLEKATDYVRGHLIAWMDARCQRLHRLLTARFPTLLSAADAKGSKSAWPLYLAPDGGIVTYDARRRHRQAPAGLAALVDEYVWIQRLQVRRANQ